MDQPLYNALRVVHIVALIGWLGLSTGAWLLLRRIRKDVSPQVLWPAFGKVVDGEHHFLGLLLASGIALLFVVGAKDQMHKFWFVLKMALIMLVIVPVECADIVKTARLKADPSAERIASYERFLMPAGAPLVLAALVIIALGKFRPGV